MLNKVSRKKAINIPPIFDNGIYNFQNYILYQYLAILCFAFLNQVIEGCSHSLRHMVHTSFLHYLHTSTININVILNDLLSPSHDIVVYLSPNLLTDFAISA